MTDVEFRVAVEAIVNGMPESEMAAHLAKVDEHLTANGLTRAFLNDAIETVIESRKKGDKAKRKAALTALESVVVP